MTDFIAQVFDGSGSALQQTDLMGTVYPIIMVVVMLGVFYFLILRPQRKRDKELKEQMSQLAVGDKIQTIGGIIGVVAQIKDDEVTISTSVAHTLITFSKSAIQTVEKRDSGSKTESKNEEEPEKKSLFGRKKKKDEDEE